MKKSRKLYVVALLLFVLSACTLASSSEELNDPIASSSETSSSIEETSSSEPYSEREEEFKYTVLNSSTILPNQSHQTIDAEFIESIRSFSSKLAKRIVNNSTNNLISTFGLFANMLMVMEATTGETKSQLETLLSLGFDYDLSNFSKVLSNLSKKRVNSYDKKTLTKTSFKNAFFASDAYSDKIKTNYLNTLKECFDADIISGNLSSDSAINFLIDYIYESTNGYLKPEFDSLIELMAYPFWFLNTNYILDTWSNGPYFSDQGDNFIFTNMNGEKIYNKRYFYGKEIMRVNEGEEFYAIDLHAFSFKLTIMIPKDGIDFSTFYANNIDNLIFNKYDSRLSKEVSFFIPFFEVKSGGKFKDAISSLGANKVYDENEAEFSFLDIDKGFRLKDTFQVSKLSVDSLGFEGASYTVSYEEPTSPEPNDKIEKLIFKADRPFLYKIESITDRIPIFVGSIADLNYI